MTVRKANFNEFDLVCDIMSEAFMHDPVLCTYFKDPCRRRETLRAFFAVTSSSARDAGTILLSSDLNGAAVYETSDGVTRSLASNDDEILLREACGADGDAAAAFARVLQINHPVEPAHYYFFAVGVRAQKRGAGAFIMSHVARLCDQAGMPCYAEATSSLCRRTAGALGWRDFRDPLELPTGATLFPLWRPPKVGTW